jgi:mono/diheme cytochrome c family protein
MKSKSKAFSLAGVLTLMLGTSTAWAWSRPPSTSDAASLRGIQTGEDLFQAKGCSECHLSPSLSSRTEMGPSLRELWKVAGSRQPGLTAEDYVRQSIASPNAFIVFGFGNNRMPQIAVRPEEIDALVDYLLDEP